MVGRFNVSPLDNTGDVGATTRSPFSIASIRYACDANWPFVLSLNNQYPSVNFMLFSIPQALASKESRGEHPARLCNPSYFVTPAAQIAV